MEKIGEDNVKLEKYLKKIEELESSVADSARRLCCRILQYEGKTKLSLVHDRYALFDFHILA